MEKRQKFSQNDCLRLLIGLVIFQKNWWLRSSVLNCSAWVASIICCSRASFCLKKTDRNKVGTLFPLYWNLCSHFFLSMWHRGRWLKSREIVDWEGNFPLVLFFRAPKFTTSQFFQSPSMDLVQENHEIFIKNTFSEILNETHRFWCSWTTWWRCSPLVKSI